MAHFPLDLNEPPIEGGLECYILLTKDGKVICRTKCIDPPFEIPTPMSISDIVRPAADLSLPELSHFCLRPAFQNSHQQKEWGDFMGFLQKYKKVAIVRSALYDFYIHNDDVGAKHSHTRVSYRKKKNQLILDDQKHSTSDENVMEPKNLEHAETRSEICGSAQQNVPPSNRCETFKEETDTLHIVEGFGENLTTNVRDQTEKCSSPKIQRTADHYAPKSRVEACCRSQSMTRRHDDYLDKKLAAEGRDSHTNVEKQPLEFKFAQTDGDHFAFGYKEDSHCKKVTQIQDHILENNFVRTDPSYLRTLAQGHSGWIFGAIAELVDNSRDAKATNLEIRIETLYSKKAGEEIPVLSVIDDGHGMSHQEIVKMLSFGHKQPNEDDPNHIGRFGIGFKTGAMRLGRDAIVLTQTTYSRSVGFLSQTFNEGKDNLEIPVVSYCRKGQFMEVDTSIQSTALAHYNLEAIKKFSPFNEYFIGEKLGLFQTIIRSPFI